MAIPELVLGKDVMMELTVEDRDGIVVDVSDADSISVALIKTDHSAVLAGPYTADPDAAGASWATGIVPVAVLGADTDLLPVTELYAEARVTGGDKEGTYFSRVKIRAIQGLV